MGSRSDEAGRLPWRQRPRESLHDVLGHTAAASICIPTGLIGGGIHGLWRGGTALNYLASFGALIGGLLLAGPVVLYVLRPVKVDPHGKPRPKLDFSVPMFEKRKKPSTPDEPQRPV